MKYFIYFICSLMCSSCLAMSINETEILKYAKGLNPKALHYAVMGYKSADQKNMVNNKKVLTVVDFSQPSNKKRLWVIDLNSSKVLLNTYTTHAKNSGLTMATSFSNKNRSIKSSLGTFKTLHPYTGKHGKSLRISGVEKGINDNALSRAIVVHPANYATKAFIQKYNRAGRSWGCFALDPAIVKTFINLTKNGSIIYAYASQSKPPKLA
jgi:hypothetical protein